MKKSIILLLSILVLLFSSCDEEIVSTGGGGSSNNNTGNTKGAETISSCRINSETKWTNHNDGIDYVIACKDLKVLAALIIEPGTTIAFESDASLIIEKSGYLSAKGTSSKMITFTGTDKIKGFWSGIAIKSPDVRNVLDYVILEYAGSSAIEPIWYNFKCGITLLRDHTSKASITNSIIRDVDGSGFVADKDGDIRQFEGNTIKDCSGVAVRVSATNVGSISSDNSYNENKFDGISIRRSELMATSPATWPTAQYYVDGKIDINSPLTLNGGTFLMGSATEVRVQSGSLNARNVTFTGEIKEQGFWNGIGFSNSKSTANKLSNVTIEYAGGNKLTHYYDDYKFALGVYDASKLSLSNCSISNSDGCGIYKGRKSSISGASSTSYASNKTGNFCNE